MFGLGFGELLVVMIVAVVVLGPKDLPRYMRKAGELAAHLRRLAFDMREKSGIDEVLRAEGLDRDIAEIRRLARGEIGGVMAAVRSTADAVRPENLRADIAAAGNGSGANGAGGGADLPATTGAASTAVPSLAGLPGPSPSTGSPVDVSASGAGAVSTGTGSGSRLQGTVARQPPPAAAPALFSTDREYPLEGADAYGSLPETSSVYDGALPASDLAADPLYARGEDRSKTGAAHGAAEAPQ